MRMLAIAAFSTVAAVVQTAESAQSTIDLDRPGVMGAMQRDNPDLHLKITQIRHLAARMPCQMDEFSRTLHVKFEVRDAGCGLTLMTSYPSKRRLQFTLGETRFVTVIEMDESENRLVPAK